MKNQALIVILAIAIFTFSSTTAFADESDYTWDDRSDGTCIITDYTGPGGDITIPDTLAGLPVTYIGCNAFYCCDSLTSVTIPGSVTGIMHEAFFQCNSLTSVTIPGSVTTIKSTAFCDCKSLTTITVDPANSVYSSIDGVWFNKSQTELIQYPPGKTGAYSIPSSVTTIKREAFYDCDGLTSVTISGSVTTIEFSAFASCDGLTSVAILGSVTTIGDCAFNGSPRLTCVIISGSVIDIGYYVFANCEGLVGVYFKGDAPSLGFDVFRHSDIATIYYIPGTSGWGETYGGRPTAEWPPSPADVDLDYEVDMYDFAVLADNWGREDCNSSNDWCNWADFDADGYVDEYDLATLAEQWLFPLGSF